MFATWASRIGRGGACRFPWGNSVVDDRSDSSRQLEDGAEGRNRLHIPQWRRVNNC